MANPSGFRFTDAAQGWPAGVDFDDVFVRQDAFVEGGLWGWGDNSDSQLGNNTFLNKRSSPVQTVSGGTNWKQVRCGYTHTAAIKTDGTLWSWGSNAFGQLGINTITNRSSPVQTVSGGTNWKQASASNTHTAAIKTDGSLWSWGYNGWGQLGIASINTVSSPVQIVSSGTNWKQVSAGSNNTAAIKTDGSLWVWGHNGYGQIGDNTVIARSSPFQTISGGNNWKQVSCGSSHTTAIKTDGTLWSWGSNSDGVLGDNTTISKSSPIQTVTGGTNWKQVATMGIHTAAIKTDGSLWLWGGNSAGQLGGQNRVSLSSPIQTVSGGTNWKQVSVSANHTAAIKTDGSLWLWGSGTEGQLGTGIILYTSSPVQTISGGTNWKQVSCGNAHTFAIREFWN